MAFKILQFCLKKHEIS
jgi:hypothetical protein